MSKPSSILGVAQGWGADAEAAAGAGAGAEAGAVRRISAAPLISVAPRPLRHSRVIPGLLAGGGIPVIRT